MRDRITPIVVSFIGMAFIYAVLFFAAMNAADPFSQNGLSTIGSAIFGGGLAFFLVRLFQIAEGRR